MHEFDLIARYFRPLAEGYAGSYALTDDAATVDVPEGMQLVVTKDLIISGVHFMGTEAPGVVARKLLRVNLSDLAAKGAEPVCYFLGGALPKDAQESWVAAFAAGLAEDQKEFSISLAGGDTTATPGPLTLSLTALGLVPKGQMLTRSGAKAGDLLYVSSFIGDAALGLKSVRGEIESRSFLEDRYHLPRPRLSIGQQLRGVASACMDISDGLVQDLGHLCTTSGVGAKVEAIKVPVSNAASASQGEPWFMETILTGGDDYELLFTVPQDQKDKVPQGCRLIGEITAGSDVSVLDANGYPMTFSKTGYKHF
jgi:thiamine-monophosphate kinase